MERSTSYHNEEIIELRRRTSGDIENGIQVQEDRGQSSPQNINLHDIASEPSQQNNQMHEFARHWRTVRPASSRFNSYLQMRAFSKIESISAYLAGTREEIVNYFRFIVRSPQVELNHYCMFMGYLSLAIKGLGYLILTWTTVVLLGGFVSMLKAKDFWSLTTVTLVQIIGVLDVSAHERLSNIGYSFMGLVVSTLPRGWFRLPIDLGENELKQRCKPHLPMAVAGALAALVQALVIILVLCPIGAAYMFGPCISAGLSTWRLIQRDYTDALDTDPSKKNLMPALIVLYSLGLLQGGLFFYRAIYSIRSINIANAIAETYGLDKEAVLEYMLETMIGVQKDISFARGWNLRTYVVGLLDSRLPEKYLSGVSLLDSLIRKVGKDRLPEIGVQGHQLLGSSTGNLVPKLLLILDESELFGYDAKEHAITIVEHFADNFYMEQYPRGFHNIVSLVNGGFKQECLRILRSLVADEGNRQVMCSMPSLLPKILKSVDYRKHGCAHGPSNNERAREEWQEFAPGMLNFLVDLMKPSEAWKPKMRPPQGMDMTSSVRDMEIIINCDVCTEELKLKEAATKILQCLKEEEARMNYVLQQHEYRRFLPAEIEEGRC